MNNDNINVLDGSIPEHGEIDVAKSISLNGGKGSQIMN